MEQMSINDKLFVILINRLLLSKQNVKMDVQHMADSRVKDFSSTIDQKMPKRKENSNEKKALSAKLFNVNTHTC